MTGIQWTDATWNPVRGCSRVSAGCEHCYAEQTARRFAGPGQPYEGLVRLTADGKPKAQWNGTVRFVPHLLDQPLRWRRPRRIFVNSMSDLFHEGVSFEQIAAVFGVMAATPRHTYQVLTKRPQRALEWFRWVDEREQQGRRMFPDDEASWRIGQMLAVTLHRLGGPDGRRPGTRASGWNDFDPRRQPWPLPNVELLVSVEDQKTADERIPLLLQCPAAIRGVSYEPALGAINFKNIASAQNEMMLALAGLTWSVSPCRVVRKHPRIDWIVIGGESGPGARPFDLAWARATISQCREAGVPVFVKQLGAAPVVSLTDRLPGCLDDADALDEIRDRKGGDMAEWPEDLRVRELPRASR